MPDEVLKKAEARRLVVKRELEELDRFIETYLRLSRDFDDAVVPSVVNLPESKPVQKKLRVRWSGGGGKSETQKTVDTVREIIEAEGKPMPLGQIFRALTDRGISMPGKNPRNTLGARLSNSEAVVPLPGFGWWLVERPFGPANYPPSDAEPADDPGGSSTGAHS